MMIFLLVFLISPNEGTAAESSFQDSNLERAKTVFKKEAAVLGEVLRADLKARHPDKYDHLKKETGLKDDNALARWLGLNLITLHRSSFKLTKEEASRLLGGKTDDEADTS